MRIFKPVWLTHGGEVKDFEVYSCHISPDGKRLATAAGDGHVRIWSIDAIYKSEDPEYSEPKQLAAISHHSGTIHAVRFSGNNKYLASGADDKIVCVYGLDPNAPTHPTFGTDEPPPVENWRVLRRLIGHDNDVQDIGWSQDSSILVSVGLDSKVVVWSGHTFEKLKTLSHHHSLVKGITFDPANKYFATASDDRTIKVFRFVSPPPNATAQDQVNNFALETTVTAPFVGSPLTTYFRRLSWSPDGVHIAAANAVNGPVASVAVINRGLWDSHINLIGHEGPVEVCAFSPRMYYRENQPDGSHPTPTITIIACAGQDNSLSVWNTGFPRPLVVTQELAEKAISDLAWSPEGDLLVLTSLDGSIMVAAFEDGELGLPAPLNEIERTLSRYGIGRKAGIAENKEALLLEESSKVGELKVAAGRMGELMGDGTSVRLPVIGSNGDGDSRAVTANPSNVTETPAPSATANGNLETNGNREPTTQTPNPDLKVDRLKQRVTITKDGKKRIAPVLIAASSGLAESSLPQTQLLSTSARSARNDAPHNVLDMSKPYDGLPKGGLAGLLIGNRRKFAEMDDDQGRRTERKLTASSRNGAVPILINGENGLVAPTTSASSGVLEPPDVLRPAIVNPSLSVSQVRLAIPMIRSVILRSVDGSDPNSSRQTENGAIPRQETSHSVMLEAKNAVEVPRMTRTHEAEPTQIQCLARGQSLWQDYLPRPVLLVTGNPNFWAAGCEDGSIHIWSPAGRRLLNALVIEAQPVILDCKGWWLLCISAVGLCHVWNIRDFSSPHHPVSLAPVLDVAAHSQGPHLTPSPGIIFARLNSAGRIIVALSNGDGYSYSSALFVWQRLSEPWWAVASQYWNTTDTSVGNLQASSSNGKGPEDGDEVSIENISAGIIPLLERNTTDHTLLRGKSSLLQRLIKSLLSAEGFEGFESNVSIAHLENRLAAAQTLGAREEFRVHLLMYAKRLGAEGLKGKIEELLHSLLGNMFTRSNGSVTSQRALGDGWGNDQDSEHICGLKKEDLLREVVLVLGKHRDLQRITVPYARLLGVIEAQPSDLDMTDAL